jgi:hypothetical protein
VRPIESNPAFSLSVLWQASAKGDIAMAIDKGSARVALERIEETISESLRALGAREGINRDDLIKNFQIRDFLVEAIKY